MKLISLFFLFLYLVSLPCLAQNAPSINESGLLGGQPLTPLEQILNPDGSVRLNGEFSGTLNPSGWQMHSGSNGQPLFKKGAKNPRMMVQEDSLWDGRFTDWNPDDWVYALAVDGSNLYVGGIFTQVGGPAGPSANYIAKWSDSGGWSALGTGMNHLVWDFAVINGNLYAGGEFTTAGGDTVNHIAKWDGTSWSALGGGVNANKIAKWDGTNWSPLGSGINNGYVLALAVNGNGLYVGGVFMTAGGKASRYIGLWHIPGVVAISEPKPIVPAGYALRQNYTDPFNPTTTISFQLPVSGKVMLKVYNVLGQEVATLINGFLPAGSYLRTFDAHSLAKRCLLLQADNKEFYRGEENGVNALKSI